jgi:hypothetical protein
MPHVSSKGLLVATCRFTTSSDLALLFWFSDFAPVGAPEMDGVRSPSTRIDDRNFGPEDMIMSA